MILVILRDLIWVASQLHHNRFWCLECSKEICIIIIPIPFYTITVLTRMEIIFRPIDLSNTSSTLMLCIKIACVSWSLVTVPVGVSRTTLKVLWLRRYTKGKSRYTSGIESREIPHIVLVIFDPRVHVSLKGVLDTLILAVLGNEYRHIYPAPPKLITY